MGYRVAVAGASGYAGGELLRLLAAIPTSTWSPRRPTRTPARRSAICIPGMRSLAGLRWSRPRPSSSPTPTWSSSPCRTASRVRSRSSCPSRSEIVDLGADHRLADAAIYERYYGGTHPGQWVYGLPELPASGR